ncbi:hypothetical protein BHE74_00034268, partial [Ensete ventricosum]
GSTDREEGDVGARQWIVEPWAWQHQGTIEMGFPWSHRSLALWRESIGHKRGGGGGEYIGKLQVPRQGRRAKAKELHKTSVDGRLIKIAKSERLRVDVGVYD